MSVSKVFYLTKDVLEAASYFFVVVGFLYAVSEFYESPNDKKRNIALEYIGNFQAEKMVDARISLLRPWLEYPMAALDGKVGSNEVVDTLALSFVFQEDRKSVLDELVRVVEFLDRFGECVESKICDKTIAMAQVSDYASDLACLYNKPLSRLRDGFALKTLGDGTMILTDQRCLLKK